MLDFEIISRIRDVEAMVIGPSIRERERLERQYGKGRWGKLKGIALVRLLDDAVRTAELHWYEAHGIGKREFKIKLPFLD